jgi:subtilisin family serine protease
MWRGGTVAALAVALAASVVASVAPGAVAQPSAQAPDGEPVSVTLVSGDRVELWGSGKAAPLRIEPAQRLHVVPFKDYWHNGDRYVVPGDAVPLLAKGVLDRELFNVTGLIRQRYDDAHTKSVPLLVEYANARARTAAAVPEGASVRRALPKLNLTALDQKKDSAQNFYGELTDETPTARSVAGVRKVWLNKRVRATLDQSVPQVGAPAAWERGLTGAGVRVAVLDTGIDSDHPDLAGKTAVSKDFTGSGGVEDGHGHGTHVASIITGSGAASGGKYRGVAPDVSLAVGKVLDDQGWGTDDGVLAGMQWAAAESGAKVISMSLGSGPTDGLDPASIAVNTLSREYGTLFVIAAGNYGGDWTVSSPATADDALTVGSVSKSDEVSDFSSRGPRLGDGAAKPEITAPGGGIVAAMPAGVPPLGEPVGDSYQQLDGTSMATPHVAGAAAILAQQHPDWSGPALKSALVSSAHEIADAGVYEVGAGRLDVDRATASPVTATAAVSVYLPWPNTGSEERRTVTWTNSGDTPVTLSLSADLVDGKGEPAPSGLVTLAADSVTVPAGGSVPVEVLVTGKDRTGTYSGVLVASDGTVQTRTAISVYQQEQRHTFTAKALDRNGVEPAQDGRSSVFVSDLDTGDIYFVMPGEPASLPRGRYAVEAAIATAEPGAESSYSVIVHPELNLEADLEQTFDARIGQPVTAEPDNPAARGGTHAIDSLTRLASCDCMFSLSVDGDARFQPLYAATLPGTASDDYALAHSRRATEPVLEMVADDGEPFEVNLQSLFSIPPAADTTLTAVYGGSGTKEDLAKIDATGKLVVVEFDPYLGREEWLRRGVNIAEAGGKLAIFRFRESGAEPLPPGDPIEGEPVTTFYGDDGMGTVDRLVALVKKGETTVSYVSRQDTKLRYELTHGVARQVTAPLTYRPKTKDLATMRAAYHDNAPNQAGYIAFGTMFGRYVGTGWFVYTAAQQERVEYFTPGDWELSWASGPMIASDTVSLAAGKPPVRIAWNKAVTGPSLRGTTRNNLGEQPHPWSWRTDGRVSVKLPMYGDGAGRPGMVESFSEATGDITVYRDGVELGTGPVTDFAEYPVPDEDSAYRVVADARQANASWTLSTVVTSEWSFRSSSAGEGKALPMLTTRFAPAVDVRNSAPGDRGFSFPAYVERQDGAAKIASLAVDVSYDDGKTWRKASVGRDGDHWKVTVRHPKSGFVSLRSSTSDVDGNRQVQTIVRAYQIG